MLEGRPKIYKENGLSPLPRQRRAAIVVTGARRHPRLQKSRLARSAQAGFPCGQVVSLSWPVFREPVSFVAKRI
jgi:hypothetical protein